MPMESRRQKKVARLIQETLSEIFQRNGANFFGKAFVTITEVRVTLDLLVAKVYLSIYNVDDKQEYVDLISTHHNEIRGQLGAKLKNQLRRIPELLFYLDNTLDEALRIEELLKGLKKDPK